MTPTKWCPAISCCQTVILSDKTDTLTENQMTVTAHHLDGGEARLAPRHRSGAAGAESPFCDTVGKPLDIAADHRMGWALRVGTICAGAGSTASVALARPDSRGGRAG